MLIQVPKTVSLFREPAPDFVHDLWDAPETLEKAGVYWKITTDRTNTLEVAKMQSTLVFHFTQEDIENISNHEEIRIFYTPDLPSDTSCWYPLPFKETDLDLTNSRLRVNREHFKGEEITDINGF